MDSKIRATLLCAGRAMVALAMLWVAGCSADGDPKPTTRPTSVRERQDQALRDPFGYEIDHSDDVSGGGLTDLDSEGLKRDLDNVLNP